MSDSKKQPKIETFSELIEQLIKEVTKPEPDSKDVVFQRSSPISVETSKCVGNSINVTSRDAANHQIQSKLEISNNQIDSKEQISDTDDPTDQNESIDKNAEIDESSCSPPVYEFASPESPDYMQWPELRNTSPELNRNPVHPFTSPASPSPECGFDLYNSKLDLEIKTEIASPDPPEIIDEFASPASPPPENTIDTNIEIKTEIVSPATSEKDPKETDDNVLDFEHEPANNGKSKEALKIKVKEEAEDGLCTPEKNIKKEQESKDDGECSEGGDEDLEDGEINEDNEDKKDGANSKLNTTKQLCRFYSRGQCFFGSNCRFQHINSASGNYSMFAPSIPILRANDYYTSHGGMMSHRSGPLPPRSSGSDFLPPAPTCPQPALEESASAWEKGLETARQLVRKANKRKIEEGPDYPEKSLNLSLNVNEKNVPEFVDNEPSSKKRRRDVQFPKYDEPLDTYEHYENKNPYRQGFENFDTRYHREDRRGGDRSRDRLDRDPRDKREFRPKSPSRSKERFRGYDRLPEVEPPRRDVNAYFDPWRRSKSPKGTGRRSRSRSYSSVSSYSWSDKSFSSNSYSRSSRSSSRSPPPHLKRKPSPTITNPPFVPSGPQLTNTFTTMKKKPEGRGGVRSSRSRTPSISRSRSFSRSISMSSVSSASSRDSLSHSSGSLSHRQNSTSVLRNQDENPALPVGKPLDPPNVSGPLLSAAASLPSMYLKNPPREKELIIGIESPVIEESEIDPLEERFLASDISSRPFPSLQHLLPNQPKEPLKVAPHKPQIKLTLLNKNPHHKMTNMPKMELANNDPTKSAGFYFGAKGPSSPPLPPVVAKPPSVLIPKKSASSRRDELLKQLKAVEDAIARKRAKFG